MEPKRSGIPGWYFVVLNCDSENGLSLLTLGRDSSEKWPQKIFNQFHAKQGEVLSLIRSVIRHPGGDSFWRDPGGGPPAEVSEWNHGAEFGSGFRNPSK